MDFPKQVVALVGPLGAGKDTVAKHLVDRHGFRRFAFADEIKRNYYAANGYSDEQFKASRGTDLEERIRAGLWQYSDRVKREKGPLYFINIVVGAIRDCPDPVVVTDIRTTDELAAMRSIGAKVILVQKIACGEDPAAIEGLSPEGRHLKVPGSRLTYGDVRLAGDGLFLNRECGDAESTERAIEDFLGRTGVLERKAEETGKAS